MLVSLDVVLVGHIYLRRTSDGGAKNVPLKEPGHDGTTLAKFVQKWEAKLGWLSAFFGLQVQVTVLENNE